MNAFKPLVLRMASALICMFAMGASPIAQAGDTFDAVKAKGFVQCGVSVGMAGFSAPNSQGVWEGLDVDLCRAIAAAMFSDASKIRLTSLSSQQRFVALQSGEVDVLLYTVTQTLTRDATMGLIGAGVNYYDSQGVIVPKSLGVNSIDGLDGATICVLPGTTTEVTLADWFRARNLTYRPVLIEQYEEVWRAFGNGRCDAFSADKVQIAAARQTLLENPADYVILPEDITKEPLGPMVRQGDEQWFNVVRWSLNAMLEAEEYGITSKNVDDILKSENPNVQRILGVDDKWAYHIIKQVGNYGESFEASVGMGSALKLERGINAQWRDGGLMYGWPIR